MEQSKEGISKVISDDFRDPPFAFCPDINA